MAKPKEEYLVCLHGFMGGAWSMRFLEKNLKKEGWEVVNWDYPSRDAYIAQHGACLVNKLIELSEKKPGKSIHFVTHSMGSLVLLAALNHPACPVEAKSGKIVLIAPPLKGSLWGRTLSRFSLIRWIAKEFSGQELLTKTSFEDLGNYSDTLESVLVVAGSMSLNPFIEGINDGILAIAETTLSTPHERVIVPRGHKTLVFSKKVYQLAAQFLDR